MIDFLSDKMNKKERKLVKRGVKYFTQNKLITAIFTQRIANILQVPCLQYKLLV